MFTMRRGKWLLWLSLLAAACTDDGGTTGDAAAGDGAVHDGAAADSGGGRETGRPDAPTKNCGTITTFADGKTPTTLLYVSPGGSDSSGDGSRARPFGSVGRAARAARPGTAIRLLAGTHAGGRGYVSGLRGTAAAPIWIGGAPGGTRPLISGGGEGLHLVKVRYLVLHDLELARSSENGINCDDGGDYADPEATRHVLFRNLSIHDIGGSGNQDCLKLSGVNDFWVLDSSFARCGGGSSGSGIDHVGCHRGLIARNTFRNMSGNAVQCKGGSTDLEVRWNRMLEPGERGVNMGGSTGFSYFRPPLSGSSPNAEARRIRVLANVIRGGTAALAFVGCVDCLAANNTVVDPNKWPLRILQETTSRQGYTFEPASRGRVINNIFYFSRGQISTFVNIGPNTQASSFSFSHDLWYAHDDPSRSRPSLPVSETAAVVGQDPGFSNPAADNYAISGASPAAGKGKALSEVRGDLTGACYKNPPAIGAHEAP